MQHPTLPEERKPQRPTDEEMQWPLEARICALAQLGVPPRDGWSMSPLESVRMLMIAQAQSIPPDERTTWASAADIKAAKLNF